MMEPPAAEALISNEEEGISPRLTNSDASAAASTLNLSRDPIDDLDDLDDVDDEDAGGEDVEADVEEDQFANDSFGSRRITDDILKKYLLMKKTEKEWWEELPDLSYSVTKINQLAKRQKRTLRLTKEGVENIRKKGKVSSMHPYEDIAKVHMKNIKTFYIEYHSARHRYQYRSPVAMHIVQEISSRLALRKKTERARLTSDIATIHQKKLEESGALMAELEMMNEKGSRLPLSPRARRQAKVSTLERKNHQAKKLQDLLGATEQQRLESAIASLLLDPSTVEGKTLKQFCANFGVLETNPATLVMNVRQFMDDLRSFIMDKHGRELSKLLIQATSQSSTPTALSLSSVIEHILEKQLIPPFRDRIVACLKQPPIEEEMELSRRLVELSNKPQHFFGIPNNLVSPNGWRGAIAELEVLNEAELPSDLLGTILSAAKAIYTTVNHEQNKGKRADQRATVFVSADDFFPIFLYVVVRTGVRKPQLLAECLWNLCDPEQLNGEGGYYLTVFCSALEYIRNINVEEEEAKFQERIKEENARSIDAYLSASSSPSSISSPSSQSFSTASSSAGISNPASPYDGNGVYIPTLSTSADTCPSARVATFKRTSSAPDFRAKLENMICDMEREAIERRGRQEKEREKIRRELIAGRKDSKLGRTTSLTMGSKQKLSGSNSSGGGGSKILHSRPIRILKAPSRFLRRCTPEDLEEEQSPRTERLNDRKGKSVEGKAESERWTSSSCSPRGSGASPTSTMQAAPATPTSATSTTSTWMTVNYRNCPSVIIARAMQTDE